MISLLFFFILSISIVILHTIKQKKSTAVFDKVVSSLLIQLDLEKQKKQLLNENINLDNKTEFKLDIIKKQINLLEHIAQ